MTLEHDWSFSCLGVTCGEGTNICPAGPIAGLGGAPQRQPRAPRGNRAGQVAGSDVHDSKTLVFPVVIKGDGGTRQTRMASAMGRALSVIGAWGAAVGSGEVECELRLPGFPGAASTLTYYGRPFDAPLDANPDALGHLPAVLAFQALDPYGYTPAVTSSLAAAVNEGTAVTDRAVITLTSSGAPTITKGTTGESFAFAEALASGTTINLRTGAVLSGGTDVSDRLAPGPLWFDLDPGDNDLSISGATATIAVESAYNI